MFKNKKTWLIYIGGFFLAAHYALVVYVNSSLLKQFVNDKTLSALYILGSLFSVASLLFAPFFLRRFGNIATFLVFIILEIIAVIGIGNTDIALLILALFILHQAAESMLYFCLDIQLEEETKIENVTGRNRGLFFTMQNIAWVVSPLLVSFLVTQNDFKNVYILSGLMLIPLFLIIALFFKNSKNITTLNSNIRAGFKSILQNTDTARIFIIQFILNFFYAWMLIYLPLLLNIKVGFSWEKIGVLFTIMLLPFLLFQLPAGFLADKKFGEKEILIIGLSIMTLATFFIPFIATASFVIWAITLFSTRIGASLVEIAGETYFFKHIKSSDSGAISLFRMVRPLALLIAPLVALPILSFLDYSSSFAFLALFTSLGLFFIPKIDTK